MRIIINVAISNFVKQFYIQSTTQLYTLFKNHNIMQHPGNYILQPKSHKNQSTDRKIQHSKWYLVRTFDELKEILEKQCNDDILYNCWICVMDIPKLQYNICHQKIMVLHENEIEQYDEITNAPTSEIYIKEEVMQIQQKQQYMILNKETDAERSLKNQLKPQINHVNIFSCQQIQQSKNNPKMIPQNKPEIIKSIQSLKKLIRIKSTEKLNPQNNINQLPIIQQNKVKMNNLPPIRIKLRLKTEQLIEQY